MDPNAEYFVVIDHETLGLQWISSAVDDIFAAEDQNNKQQTSTQQKKSFSDVLTSSEDHTEQSPDFVKNQIDFNNNNQQQQQHQTMDLMGNPVTVASAAAVASVELPEKAIVTNCEELLFVQNYIPIGKESINEIESMGFNQQNHTPTIIENQMQAYNLSQQGFVDMSQNNLQTQLPAAIAGNQMHIFDPTTLNQQIQTVKITGNELYIYILSQFN